MNMDQRVEGHPSMRRVESSMGHLSMSMDRRTVVMVVVVVLVVVVGGWVLVTKRSSKQRCLHALLQETDDKGLPQKSVRCL